MALVGIPLILLSALLTAAVCAGTVLLWSRYGRWRLVSRTVGVLLGETLIVLTVGLVVNRHEQFYPSWQALAGNTGTTSSTAAAATGRLDTAFGPGRLQVPWQPPGAPAWRLTSAAQVAVPPAYPAGHGSYPVLLALGGQPATADLVRIVLRPGRQTTAAALADLPAAVTGDLRVTGHGWVLVAAAPMAVLATRLIRALPGRFSALAVVGTPPPGFVAPPDVAVAVAEPAAGRGAHRPEPGRGAHPPALGPSAHQSAAARGARPGKHPSSAGPHPATPRPPAVLPAGISRLSGGWAAATAWAVAQSALPLAAPEVLPSAGLR